MRNSKLHEDKGPSNKSSYKFIQLEVTDKDLHKTPAAPLTQRDARYTTSLQRKIGVSLDLRRRTAHEFISNPRWERIAKKTHRLNTLFCLLLPIPAYLISKWSSTVAGHTHMNDMISLKLTPISQHMIKSSTQRWHFNLVSGSQTYFPLNPPISDTVARVRTQS